MSPLIYQPAHEIKYRVTWYPTSSQLHFEKYSQVVTPNFDGTYQWLDIDVRSFMEPLTGVKRLYQEMEDYYHYCLMQEQDYLQSLM